MGIFDFLKGNKTQPQPQNTAGGHTQHQPQPQRDVQVPQNSGQLLDMKKQEAVQLINMRKEKVDLLCMQKPVLANVRARVGVAMDYSGSMSDEFRSGLVQDVVERLLPISLRFDDNGELDMWLFENGMRRLPTVTLGNFFEYVEREILAHRWHMGGTEYAPVMRDIMKKYIKEQPSETPTYIIFITDGDNSDKKATEDVIRESCKHNIFWQFVGIGNASFGFLEKLDDLKGRPIDNTDFFQISNIRRTTDEQLYANLLNEYPGWEAKARQMGMVR